jgi:hypothetical protein
MDKKQILADLRAELNRINQAIAALESLDVIATASVTTPAAKAASKQPEKRHLTPAARKRISVAAKARWAARRKASAKSAPDQPRVKARRGGGRKKRRTEA